MKIYLIIVEEPFFHPGFVREIIRRKKEEIVGITIVPDISPKTSKVSHFLWLWNFFGSGAFFYLGIKTIVYKILDFISQFIYFKRFYSVQKTAQHYKVPIYETGNINNEDHLKYLRNLKPDIIISAQGQIFKKELLNLPEIACLNRHSALLPQYGGLWPVFWAMLKGEKKIGVTVHTMVEKIDAGQILSQKEIDVLPGDSLYNLYQKAFKISPEVVLEALDKLSQSKPKSLDFQSQNSSYFSLPKKEDINLFHQKGLKII